LPTILLLLQLTAAVDYTGMSLSGWWEGVTGDAHCTYRAVNKSGALAAAVVLRQPSKNLIYKLLGSTILCLVSIVLNYCDHLAFL